MGHKVTDMVAADALVQARLDVGAEPRVTFERVMYELVWDHAAYDDEERGCGRRHSRVQMLAGECDYYRDGDFPEGLQAFVDLCFADSRG
jgi:hypothetical protein